MKTKKQWDSRHRPIAIASKFTRRIADDLFELNIPIHDSVKQIDFDSGAGLYLHGNTSTGKTLLACELLLREQRRAWLEGGHKLNRKFEFVSTPDLLFKIKQTFGDKEKNSEEQIINHYSSKVHFLVLDDFGVISKSSEWVLNTFYLIINGRYENKLPTVFTSNIDLNEVAELFDDRIASRIQRMCKVIKKNPWDE